MTNDAVAWRFRYRNPNGTHTPWEYRQNEPLSDFGDREIQALYAEPLLSDDEAMRRLSASEVACYRWPMDTAEHRAMRAAFVDGAASVHGVAS